MRSISMTIAHPAAQVAGCSGALRAITVGAENARSRVLAGPRDSGRHFVSKCSHCACSVSHEREPNARSYVKSPPPPPTWTSQQAPVTPWPHTEVLFFINTVVTHILHQFLASLSSGQIGIHSSASLKLQKKKKKKRNNNKK